MKHLSAIRSLVAVALVAGLALPMTGAHASDTGCLVTNLRTGQSESVLQTAVDAAQAGDRLRVRGECRSFQASRDIALIGPATLRWPVCDTCGPGGPLADISAGRVVLKHLSLQGGSSTFYGGAILNWGGTLVLRGRTSVTGSLAEDGGGGIYNEGTLVMAGSSAVVGNDLLYGPGGGVWNVGTTVMKDRSVVADNNAIFGGGLYNAGMLLMKDRSLVRGNSAQVGGGIYNTGKLILRGGASVRYNTATPGPGGGIYSSGEVITRHWWGSVCANTPDNWYREP